jgi:hypothetical protein
MERPMTEQKTAAPAPQTGGGRSVNYPFITLEEGIKRAKSLWDHVGKNLVPIPTAAPFWGYAEKSSGLRSTVSALKQYGLIQDVGDSDGRQIRLTDRALDILIESADSPKRTNAIRQAALTPKIYADILARFPEGIPTADSAIKSYLLREKNFNRKAVDSFIADFRANFQLAKITSSANMPYKKDEEASELDHPESMNQEAQKVDSLARENIAWFAQSVFGPGVEVASFPVAKDCMIRLRATGPLTKSGVENLIKQLQLGLDIDLYPDTAAGIASPSVTKDKESPRVGKEKGE